MKTITQKIDMYRLTVVYYLQGDSWEDAKALAKRLVYGFK